MNRDIFSVHPLITELALAIMGLAGPKNNTKISKDPRNTFWSNDTSRFGHKYLSSLGWAPGQTLGDNSSSYHTSGHISNASSTGVKILLKDDNLGIGAKNGAQHDECTGLLGLQGLLGRLNGDEKCVESVRKEVSRRKDQWVLNKFGIQFVKGEVWKADDISKLREQMVKDNNSKAMTTVIEKEDESKKRKKRKRGADTKEGANHLKASEFRGSKVLQDDSDSVLETRQLNRIQSSSTSASVSGDDAESRIKKRSRREEKEQRKKCKEVTKKGGKDRKNKEEKNKGNKKKEKRKAKTNSNMTEVTTTEFEDPSDMNRASTSVDTTRSATPVAPITGRQAVRARFIAAKRNAIMDSRALNEILMIKG